MCVTRRSQSHDRSPCSSGVTVIRWLMYPNDEIPPAHRKNQLSPRLASDVAVCASSRRRSAGSMEHDVKRQTARLQRGVVGSPDVRGRPSPSSSLGDATHLPSALCVPGTREASHSTARPGRQSVTPTERSAACRALESVASGNEQATSRPDPSTRTAGMLRVGELSRA